MKPLSVLLLLLPLKHTCSVAQNLTGTWEGRTSRGEYVKMVLTGRDSVYVGYTYDVGMGYCKVNFMGNFAVARQLLKGQGQGFIEKTFGHAQSSFKLTFKSQPDGDYLVGILSPKTVAVKILAFGLFLQLRLKRISSDIDTTAYMFTWLQKNINITGDSIPGNIISYQDNSNRQSAITNDSVNGSGAGLSNGPVANQQQPPVESGLPNYDSLRTIKDRRQSDVLKTIVTHADSIVITISDNEIVDGDTVTVFHNNDVLVSRLFVSAHPWRVVISINKNEPRHEFVMVANNLGRIPPNTALLNIEAGREHYQLKASSDMTRNAVIIFQFRE